MIPSTFLSEQHAHELNKPNKPNLAFLRHTLLITLACLALAISTGAFSDTTHASNLIKRPKIGRALADYIRQCRIPAHVPGEIRIPGDEGWYELCNAIGGAIRVCYDTPETPENREQIQKDCNYVKRYAIRPKKQASNTTEDSEQGTVADNQTELGPVASNQTEDNTVADKPFDQWMETISSF